jgi:hypothetical protein
VEVDGGSGIAGTTGHQQYSPQHLDRVLRQVGLSEECDPNLVVTDHIPTMQGVLVTQMGDELGDRHVSPGPWDDTVRIHLEHLSDQRPHSLLLSIEAEQERLMIHRLEGSLALFKGTSRRNRITL